VVAGLRRPCNEGDNSCFAEINLSGVDESEGLVLWLSYVSWELCAKLLLLLGRVPFKSSLGNAACRLVSKRRVTSNSAPLSRQLLSGEDDNLDWTASKRRTYSSSCVHLEGFWVFRSENTRVMATLWRGHVYAYATRSKLLQQDSRVLRLAKVLHRALQGAFAVSKSAQSCRSVASTNSWRRQTSTFVEVALMSTTPSSELTLKHGNDLECRCVVRAQWNYCRNVWKAVRVSEEGFEKAILNASRKAERVR